MGTDDSTTNLEEQIGLWRNYLKRRQAIQPFDVAELEDHLRQQIAVLTDSGLAADEAFFVAVKRIGDLNALSREFAREHSERLWKQLVALPAEGGMQAAVRTDAIVAICLAVLAGLLFKAPLLFGIDTATHETFYLRNLALFVLPLLTGYFAWKRQLHRRLLPVLAGAFAVAMVAANVHSWPQGSNTEALLALHLPIALWLVVGIAYAGGRWHEVAGRMDFVRFSGELFIYFVLIALGGGVLTAFTAMIFQAAGIDIEPYMERWLPSCAIGAVLVAAWLVEAKQSVIENMAPVLARLFTPLFTLVLLVFLGMLLVTGRGLDIQREVLIAFDLLLALVLGLLLYSASARDQQAPPGVYDVLQIVLVISALAVDAVALWAVAARINEFGFTPNRVAALGENLILLVNLAWSAVLLMRFVRGRATCAAIEKWQTGYVPVYAAWATVVVIAFPLIFSFT